MANGVSRIKISGTTWKPLAKLYQKTSSGTWTEVTAAWTKDSNQVWQKVYPTEAAIETFFPGSLSFIVYKNFSSASQTVTLTNTGTATMTVLQVRINSASIYSTNVSLSSPLPITLAVGQSATLSVLINGTSVGTASGNLEITYDSGILGQVTSVLPITATVMPNFGDIAVSYTNASASYLWDTTANDNPPSSVVTVTNTGNGGNLVISSITGGGTVISGAPTVILPNRSAQFTILPPSVISAGTTNYTVTINSNAQSSPTTTLAVSRTMVPRSAIINVVSSLSPVVHKNYTITGTVPIINSGNYPLVISSIVAESDASYSTTLTLPSLPMTITAGATKSFGVAFTGITPATASGNITIFYDPGYYGGTDRVINVSATIDDWYSEMTASLKAYATAFQAAYPSTANLLVKNTGIGEVLGISSIASNIGSISGNATLANIALSNTLEYKLTIPTGQSVGSHCAAITIVSNARTNSTQVIKVPYTVVAPGTITYDTISNVATTTTTTVPNYSGLLTSGIVTYTTTTRTTYTYSDGVFAFKVPEGVTHLTVTSLGAGGGGQTGWGNYGGSGGAGAGGNAGAYVSSSIVVTPGQNLSVTVGLRGAGGAGGYAGGTSADGPSGTAGNPSFITGYPITTAAGGQGGYKGNGWGNYNRSYPAGNWEMSGSWGYGYAGQNSAVATGGAKGTPSSNGGVGGQGAGGGGGASSNYDPNDTQTNGGNGGNGSVTISW